MTQSRLDFTHELPPASTVNAIRDKAIAQVAQHAEDRAPGFSERAQACILAYLEQHGPSSGEVLTLACKAAGIVAHDDRAIGGVFRGLACRGQIVKAGSCQRRRGHNTNGGTIWRLA